MPPGTVGRIRVRGEVVSTEFWNDPEASREAFRDGWYYPGDLGSLDADGYLTLAGRAKDMIIRGGVNIYPAEVEAVLQAHPAVVDSAVVGWPSKEFNEEVAAFVILKGNVTPAQLRDLCKQQLAPYKVRGVASWYGHPYHGRRAASGEIYDMEKLTAAHRTLPFGTPDDVRNEVRERFETLGPGGGFIFCTAHNIQIDTPIENVVALFEAYHEFGAY